MWVIGFLRNYSLIKLPHLPVLPLSIFCGHMPPVMDDRNADCVVPSGEVEAGMPRGTKVVREVQGMWVE